MNLKKINFSIKSVLIIVILTIIGCISLNGVTKKSGLTTEEIFEKDEYCRNTYSESFVKNYEKVLLGRDGEEREYITLFDIFYSPKENECYVVYDYYYFNFRDVVFSEDGERIDLNNFQRRISRALSAENVIDQFELTLTGNIKEYEERVRFDEAIEDLKKLE